MSSQENRLIGVERIKRPGPGEPLEERGILTEVIVPIAASGVAGAAGGAANAVVSNLLKKKDK
jgi:hypothetical protein